MEHELTNEAELIQRMLAGEARAFQAFFENHFPRLYWFARCPVSTVTKTPHARIRYKPP